MSPDQFFGWGASFEDPSPDGYGATGFQASGVTLPTESCWEITGEVGETTLSFVTLVVTRAGWRAAAS